MDLVVLAMWTPSSSGWTPSSTIWTPSSGAVLLLLLLLRLLDSKTVTAQQQLFSQTAAQEKKQTLSASAPMYTRARPSFTSKIGDMGVSITIPHGYSRNSLPNKTLTEVNIGIDIKDLPNVNDHDFSVTLNGFFLVRWRDPRLIMENVQFGSDEDALIPVDVSLVDEIWMPDIEILNLKQFSTLDVLSKLEGLWLNKKLELIYAVACRITWICPMTFDNFPLDVQVCRFQVGSFNYDSTKIIFKDEFVADSSAIKSVLDYWVDISELKEEDKVSQVLTGNYSVTGFQLILKRKMSHYIITYYFPAGMFVIVSWISFLVPPESVPGRMTILVTVFLVLVNIFNSITSNIPKADGLTAIEMFMIVNIIFVFCALIEYAVILFSQKIKTSQRPRIRKDKMRSATDVQSAFMRMDVNGDGTLTKREMLAAEEFTPEEIEAIYELGDVDGDGEIDMTEFVALMCPTEKEKEDGLEDKDKQKATGNEVAGLSDKVKVARQDLFFLCVFPAFYVVFNVCYWILFMRRSRIHDDDYDDSPPQIVSPPCSCAPTTPCPGLMFAALNHTNITLED